MYKRIVSHLSVLDVVSDVTCKLSECYLSVVNDVCVVSFVNVPI